ncbi:E3 ubiquitin-protein ligase ZSWIM2 [Hoplias malabaricus]|uniref:E3 ubiquitin-protein ligase ZSWIM2 n=1 Tax=Hoplias malabaricus TaxID=27720 RepID=UPI0034632D59
MFRKTAWRKTVTDSVNWHQDQALNTTILILREFGPTGFLLKENGESKYYKVCLGDLHTCTCATFLKEKDLCKHICWILMRKFRLPRDHEYCFQPGLVDRQILEVLKGLYRVKTPRPADSIPSVPPQPGFSVEDGEVRQKAIGEDDICPICQEELLKKRLPVTHCRFGCGNSIHISCMKVWSDHQTRSETDVMVKCPLCREDFGALKLLLEEVKAAGKLCTASEKERLDKHLGIPCNHCRICPIVGKCFKCTLCSYFHLCDDCFKRNSHPQHSFIYRQKRNQPWQPVEQSLDHHHKQAQIIDSQLVYINSTDAYDFETSDVSDVVPDNVLRSLPVQQVRKGSKLLELGVQCRFCLQSFHLGQRVKTLPCRHKFHSDCIDSWLGQSVSCPLDWQVIYNPLTWNSAGVQVPVTPTNRASTSLTDQQHSDLFIPGFSLLDRTAKEPVLNSTVGSDISTAGPCDPLSFQSLCINNTYPAVNGSDCRSKASVSIQRCESVDQAQTSTSKRRTCVKATFPGKASHFTACIKKKIEHCERTQLNLFPELNKHANKMQPKNSAHLGHTKPLRTRRESLRPQPPGEDLSSLDLCMTSTPISVKPQKNQE